MLPLLVCWRESLRQKIDAAEKRILEAEIQNKRKQKTRTQHKANNQKVFKKSKSLKRHKK
jgi:hypothetical protein